MARVFVSHASADYNFVSLLEAILKYHYVDVWASESDIEAGREFVQSIEEAVREANILVVVASQHALKSKWVTSEFVQFHANKPDALIVPIVLDLKFEKLDQIAPGLARYEAIDFSKSHYQGYVRLLGLLGKTFLEYTDRRFVKDERRDESDRRLQDRRVSELAERLRRGFWIAFARNTGLGEFHEFELSRTDLDRPRVIRALRNEVAKYRVLSGTTSHTPADALEIMAYRVWDMLARKGSVRAVYLVEGIAEELFNSYDVELASGRRNQEKRAGTRRKEDGRSPITQSYQAAPELSDAKKNRSAR